MLDFSGKNVLVTGGSRGIGAATVRLFVKLGANVIFNYNKNYRAASNLSIECEKYSGQIFFEECDVSDYTEVESFLEKAINHLGRIDIVVNNAGIWRESNIDSITVDEWRKTMYVNLDSVFYFCTLVARHMKTNEIKGSIINISSTAGQVGEAFHAPYAASKGGIISYTKSLATELGPLGIRVNCVAPGWVKTDMTEATMQTEEEKIRSKMSLGFIPEAEDIAPTIIFLASDMARAITGEVLNVNAGSVLIG